MIVFLFYDQLKEKLKRTYRHGDSYYSILLKLQDIYKRIDIIEDCCFSDLGLSHEDLIKISNELYQYNKQAEQRDRYKLHF